MSPWNRSYLPRLEKHHYRGHAYVFWTNTVEHRAVGWLTSGFHATFREIMLHSASREHVFCPAYCLMPDHIHLVWMGMRPASDQLKAIAFLRTHLESALGADRVWQHQPHDRVVREADRERSAFADTCAYILRNPVRMELVATEADWPYAGTIIPGYPDLHPLAPNFWERFWKLYAAKREEGVE